ncbi:MAG: hypothetical protein ABFD64_06645 [Armatimonadota bacterium]
MDESDEYLTHSIFFEGVDLSPDKADELEKKLKVNPEDINSRAMLIGYCFAGRGIAARQKRGQHVLWVIENCPEDCIAGMPPFILNPIIDKDTYPIAKTLWLNHVSAKPENTKILGNAANFFTIHEREIAIELLKKAQIIEPDNPTWPDKLGHVYMLDTLPIHNTTERIRTNAAVALEEFEKAYRLSSQDHDFGQISILENLAKSAFSAEDTDKAAIYADKLLQKLVKHKDYFNFQEAFHAGNLTLGRVALIKDDLPKAKEYLLNSGHIPDSQGFFKFDPGMMLAKELLELGEKEVVLEYLALCKEFWNNGQSQLDKWIKKIRRGRTPRFDVSLMY